MRPWDYETRWWCKQIAWLKLHDFACFVRVWPNQLKSNQILVFNKQGKSEYLRKNQSVQRRKSDKLNQYRVKRLGFPPRPHCRKASPFTTAPKVFTNTALLTRTHSLALFCLFISKMGKRVFQTGGAFVGINAYYDTIHCLPSVSYRIGIKFCCISVQFCPYFFMNRRIRVSLNKCTWFFSFSSWIFNKLLAILGGNKWC